jgi:hypothetical protein
MFLRSDFVGLLNLEVFLQKKVQSSLLLFNGKIASAISFSVMLEVIFLY